MDSTGAVIWVFSVIWARIQRLVDKNYLDLDRLMKHEENKHGAHEIYITEKA